MRLDRGERVISDLRVRRGNSRNKRRLTRIRKTNEAHVREQLQLKLEFIFLARAPFLVITRSAICRRRKMRIAKSATPAARREPARAILLEIAQQLVGLRIENLGADRDAHDGVFAFFTRSVAAFTMHSPAGNVQRVVLQVQQSIQRGVGLDPHVAAAATVAPRWTTTGHELLATKRRHAVAAVAALDANFCSIDEHL